VTLIAADSNGATLEVDGRRQRYTLSDHIGTSFKADKHPSVTIWPNRGMYQTTGSINGLPVDFLIDTGASMVAMNAAMARRLGIAYRLDGTPMIVQTASGQARAYQVTLDKVKVGAIEVRNVSAAVIDGPQPQTTLLGSTFLSKVKLQRDGEAMTLTQKW
jgi:aspartyl protease family protein